MRYLSLLLIVVLSGCATKVLVEKPKVLMPVRAEKLEWKAFLCQPNVCLTEKDAKNLTTNLTNDEAYIKQLENLLNSVTEPQK